MNLEEVVYRLLVQRSEEAGWREVLKFVVQEFGVKTIFEPACGPCDRHDAYTPDIQSVLPPDGMYLGIDVDPDACFRNKVAVKYDPRFRYMPAMFPLHLDFDPDLVISRCFCCLMETGEGIEERVRTLMSTGKMWLFNETFQSKLLYNQNNVAAMFHTFSDPVFLFRYPSDSESWVGLVERK